ncbi:SAM-dependent methyltransferase [Streptomyces spiramenti]|uniref:Methyltransferase domain-containing protein n=1 Tax=Streptomyces spiramenti TaxID=2720606 RepID=A0ABX1ALC2_9ACTN|nr:methyltransferase domain-containing protein [Streptomyces spiramenti]NJP65187.1 methyltransferase domain-containing protein [Streptomyces spiramenti]
MAHGEEVGLITYLQVNRAFLAPVIERAVARLGLGDRRRVLDVGTGAGGGLVALARATGPAGRVLAVDRSEDALALARRHAATEGVIDRVRFEAADLLTVASQAAAGERFDAIWAGDVIWPGNVPAPQRAVAQLADALAPGGVLALFTSNYYNATFLPGHPRLERQLMTASELNWGIPADGPDHYARHVHWMHDAGLTDVRLHVLPRTGFPVDQDPTVRAYLESIVWPELLGAARTKGREAGMSSEDLELAEALLRPGGPKYIADEPGYYLVHPALLVTGTR